MCVETVISRKKWTISTFSARVWRPATTHSFRGNLDADVDGITRHPPTGLQVSIHLLNFSDPNSHLLLLVLLHIQLMSLSIYLVHSALLSLCLLDSTKNWNPEILSCVSGLCPLACIVDLGWHYLFGFLCLWIYLPPPPDLGTVVPPSL